MRLSPNAVKEITATFNAMTNTTVTVAEYIEHYFPGATEWAGDVCGCTDDRCSGYHHGETESCGCIDVQLDDLHDALVDRWRVAQSYEDDSEK